MTPHIGPATDGRPWRPAWAIGVAAAIGAAALIAVVLLAYAAAVSGPWAVVLLTIFAPVLLLGSGVTMIAIVFLARGGRNWFRAVGIGGLLTAAVPLLYLALNH